MRSRTHNRLFLLLGLCLTVFLLGADSEFRCSAGDRDDCEFLCF